MLEDGKSYSGYRVIRKVGHGGFGWVFEAVRDENTLDIRYALKVPDPGRIDPKRCWEEARLWKLAAGHPGVMDITDCIDCGGFPALVSLYVETKDLRHTMVAACGEPLDIQEIVDIILGILDGLVFLHSKGIVH